MKIIEKYNLVADHVPAEVTISEKDEEFVNTYDLTTVRVFKPTETLLEHVKKEVITNVHIDINEMLDIRAVEKMKKRFFQTASSLLEKELIGISENEKLMLVGKLMHEMIGLGELELLLSDENLEEIVINSSEESLWVYHKKHGWLKTNIRLPTEEKIQNYASSIGRRVGRQITNLSPLLDAHLSTGDRVNATLFPISTKGHSITIRKFAKSPWTITRMLDPSQKVLNLDVAALLWLCVQYELNILVGGGTASGKTSVLNAMLAFTPSNQRVISIEDTRELFLPEFLQWTPLVTRAPNPEGKGEVTMLDLVVNSLRMRPDRIIMGEIRRQREAEVLFEAMHTGHAVYATVHGDNVEQVKSRLTSPPINLPEPLLSSLHLVIILYRQRRTGIRRLYEVAEVIPNGHNITLNKIYKWNPKTDILEKVGEYERLLNELLNYTGMSS
ncbi:CpaF family protein, partial [Candidatus Micrarchaeota archaeon]|nr:CpaF family protein [Candidatus Micrarchaeota archaeon]